MGVMGLVYSVSRLMMMMLLLLLLRAWMWVWARWVGFLTTTSSQPELHCNRKDRFQGSWKRPGATILQE